MRTAPTCGSLPPPPLLLFQRSRRIRILRRKPVPSSFVFSLVIGTPQTPPAKMEPQPPGSQHPESNADAQTHLSHQHDLLFVHCCCCLDALLPKTERMRMFTSERIGLLGSQNRRLLGLLDQTVLVIPGGTIERKILDARRRLIECSKRSPRHQEDATASGW